MKTELFREINGRFFLIDHGDPHFLLYKLNQDSVPIESKIKKLAKIYHQILHSLKKSYKKGHLG